MNIKLVTLGLGSLMGMAAVVAGCNAEEEPLLDGGIDAGDAGIDATPDAGDGGGDVPAACEGPDPSVSCLDTGCPDGRECTQVDGGCAPSHCACEGGLWACTADCGPEYACTPAPEPCPEEPEIGGACASEAQECSWGSECCCGGCSPSLVCTCSGASWGCYATDACMIESCAGRSCTSDDDCDGGEIPTTCVDGTCAAPVDPVGFAVGPRIEVQTDCAPFTSDGYTSGSAAIDGDTLRIALAYGGGCAEHLFRVCWDGSFMESAPVQVSLDLQHEANDDPCDGVMSSEIEIPLAALRSAYASAYRQSSGTIVIHVAGETLRFDFDECTGEALPPCPAACDDGAFARCGATCDPDVDLPCGNEIGDGMSCLDGAWACAVHPPLTDGCNRICRR